MERVIELFHRKGSLPYYNLGVTHAEHALQSAYLAEYSNLRSPTLIVACLLHDIGHLVESDAVPMIHEGESLDDSVGVIDHEKIGADFARMNGYGSIIEDLILTHVDAKRVSKHEYNLSLWLRSAF